MTPATLTRPGAVPVVAAPDGIEYEGAADAVEKMLLLAAESAQLPAEKVYDWIDALKLPGADLDEPIRMLRAAGRPDAAWVLDSIEALSHRVRGQVFAIATLRADQQRRFIR